MIKSSFKPCGSTGPNGSVQLAETVIGNVTVGREYSLNFNFRID